MVKAHKLKRKKRNKYNYDGFEYLFDKKSECGKFNYQRCCHKNEKCNARVNTTVGNNVVRTILNITLYKKIITGLTKSKYLLF